MRSHLEQLLAHLRDALPEVEYIDEENCVRAMFEPIFDVLTSPALEVRRFVKESGLFDALRLIGGTQVPPREIGNRSARLQLILYHIRRGQRHFEQWEKSFLGTSLTNWCKIVEQRLQMAT